MRSRKTDEDGEDEDRGPYTPPPRTRRYYGVPASRRYTPPRRGPRVWLWILGLLAFVILVLVAIWIGSMGADAWWEWLRWLA